VEENEAEDDEHAAAIDRLIVQGNGSDGDEINENTRGQRNLDGDNATVVEP